MAHVARARRPYPLLVAAAVLLALGATTAWEIGDALGLSHSPAAVPREDAVAAPARTPAPVPPLASLVVPDEPRVRKAAAAVADAVVSRGLPRPVLAPAAPRPARSATAAPGTGAAPDLSAVTTLRAGVLAIPGGAPESYRLDVHGAELAVQGGDVAGVAAGMYRLADRIRSGAEALPAADAGRVVVPRLGLRLTDAGSVGREPDPAAFAAGDDYGLNTDVVASAVLPGAPWVDADAVARIDAQFRQLVDHSVAQGFNGIVVPGFLEYVTFAKVGDGHAVYPPGDPHVDRARAMVAAFGPVFRYAEDMGVRVFLLTDMLAVSPPLEAYLTRTVGGLDVADPRLWAVYQAGLAELFESMPFIDGLMVRVGEGGEVYAGTGWDYSSRLAVTTETSVRAMLRALLDTAGAAGKEIIFRTWTVGVGAVGDLHTNPESYERVLGGLDDPHLIVSTKYTLGDFYSHLPLNTTLLGGKHRRIVEFQARREFEAFGSLPNDLGPLHRQALRAFLAANPNVEGVWNWTQDGGPLRAGPMSLHLRAGFWQLYELNTYAVGRLAWDPHADPAQVTADWAYRTFSGDPATVAAIGQAMALSRQAVTRGLYIGPYADRSVRALGLEPPPMMWIFEWDIPTGDSAALDSIYAVTGDRVDEAVEEGTQAVALARRMRDLVAATDPATWRDAELRARFTATLDYQVDLFGTLGAYRAMVLRHAQWLDTGSPAARHDWRAGRRGVPRRTRRAPAALRRRPGPARVQLHRRRPRGAARRPGPGDGLGGPGVARVDPARGAARPARARVRRGRRARVAARRAPAVAGGRAADARGAGGPGAGVAGPGRGAGGEPARADLVRRAGAPAGHPRWVGAVRPRRTPRRRPAGPVPPVGRGRRRRAAAQRAAAGRARRARTGRLLVRLLDRAGSARGVRHRRVRGVLLAVRGRRRGPAGPVRPAPPKRRRADSHRRGRAPRRVVRPGLGGGPGTRADGVERSARAAALGPVPHPRHHRPPGHPRPTPRVHRRRRSRPRRRRPAGVPRPAGGGLPPAGRRRHRP
ncbi:hypothetical protein AB0I85_19365 [Micromonospora echinofusca]|uniref:hypothetical protein n=1 Tax=Micromonospora echinofusca TaxID=47858 RepID=UPI0033E52D26